jgi:hypothetical protein
MRILQPATLASVLLLSGCFKSYVAVGFHPPPLPAQSGEIVSAEPYQKARGAVRRVALRAPTPCLGESAAQQGGGGLGNRWRAIQDSRCDVWLGELENALAGAGYQVTSWRKQAGTERIAGTPQAAARELGADLVLEVNDLVLTPVFAGVADDRTIGFDRSDSAGADRGPAALSDEEHAALVALVRERYPDGALTGLSATIDARAVAVGSGEPVWAYRRTTSDDLSAAQATRILLRGRGETWRPILPSSRGRAAAAPAGGEDPLQSRARDLARAIAKDLVTRFVSGA